MLKQIPKTELEEKDILVDRVRLNYRVRYSNKSTNIILVHGIAVSSRYMLPLAEELSSEYNVYAIDLPGFGGSGRTSQPSSLDMFAKSLCAFIDQTSISSPVLVGNSFGCQVILRFLKMYPGVATRAILIGQTMNIYERNHLRQMQRWVQNLKYEPTSQLAWILIKDLVECGPVRVFRTLSIGLKDTPEDGLDQVKVPLLFMRGSLDPIAPKAWLEYLAASSPLFQVEELPGAGHALNYNSPRPLAKIIKKFIDSTEL